MKLDLWKGIAILAAVFMLLVSLLTIVNYLQIQRADPIHTETINLLVDRLNQNPQDVSLRDQIRELDLLVRKAYFTNQWQVRTGAYLLLISLAVFIIAMQIVEGRKKPQPELETEETEGFLSIQKNTRRWVAVGGGVLVTTALLLTYLTHSELENRFELAAQGKPEVEKQLPAKDSVVVVQNKQADVSKQAEVVPVPEVLPNVEESKEVEKKPVEVQPKQIAENEKIEPESPKKTEPSKTISEQTLKNNFPSFRGYGGNGVSFKENLPLHWDGPSGENVLWKTEIPLHGYNSPIVWEDKVFLTGANDERQEVYCFNGNTGVLVWTAVIDNIPGSPAVSPEVTPDTGHAAPTMCTDGTHVYAIFSTGDVVALDMSGSIVWARNLGVPRNHYGHSSSLLTYEDKLLIQYDHSNEAKVMALNTQTGETLWSTARKVKVSWASPVLVNTGSQMELILNADPLVASYNPETGEELWQLKCMMGEVGPSVVYADGVVFAMNEYASLVAIQLGEQATILWEDDEFLSDVPSPVATDQYLFVATSYGVLVCYDAKTGEKYWEQEYDDGFYSSMMMNGDHIYLIDKRGITHIFKASNVFEEIAASPLGEAVYTTPAMGDKSIYIRAEKHLYRIGM